VHNHCVAARRQHRAGGGGDGDAGAGGERLVERCSRGGAADASERYCIASVGEAIANAVHGATIIGRRGYGGVRIRGQDAAYGLMQSNPLYPGGRDDPFTHNGSAVSTLGRPVAGRQLPHVGAAAILPGRTLVDIFAVPLVRRHLLYILIRRFGA
jgi:hypothetical protein